MHSGDLAELEKSDLSEQEKEALLQVMQRAKVSGGPRMLVFSLHERGNYEREGSEITNRDRLQFFFDIKLS